MSAGLLIDSSVIIASERGSAALAQLSEQSASVAISAVTVIELWKGVERADSATRRDRRAAMCERIVSSIDVLDLDAPTARAVARLWADLERVGSVLSAFDLVIAGTALAHGLVLATFDRDFEVVPELELIVLAA